MKAEVFKKLIKQSVREVFQEELKSIVLEAIKGNGHVISEFNHLPNTSGKPPITQLTENTNSPELNIRNKYSDIMGGLDTFTTSDINIPKFRPHSSTDTINGALPEGDVDLEMITALMSSR